MKGLLKRHKQLADNSTYGAPGLRDTAIPAIMDHTFNRNGRKWRVSSVADTFVIGTAYFGWVLSMPKSPDYSPWINVFYAGSFIMFFILGVILRYHLGAKQ